MNDRELLELAAKAAGWTWWKSKHGYWNIKGPDCEERAACCGWFKFDSYTGSNFAEPTPADALIEVGFSPLDDDAEAFRLAVKLGLLIDCDDVLKDVEVVLVTLNPNDQYVRMNEPYGDDPYAATRRAIVRAAAEIEREACAKIAEDFLTQGRSPLGQSVASAVRARGEK